MRTIVEITLNSSLGNDDKVINFFYHKVRLVRIGVDSDLQLMKELIKQWDGKCHCLCLSGHPFEFTGKVGSILQKQVNEIYGLIKSSRVIDGRRFREVYFPYAIHNLANSYPDLLKNKNIGFFCGIHLSNIVEVVQEFSNRVYCADPYYFYGFPRVTSGIKQFKNFERLASRIFYMKMLNRKKIIDFSTVSFPKEKFLNLFFFSDVFITTASQLENLRVDHLEGKTLIIDSVPQHLEQKIQNLKLRQVISCIPTGRNIPSVSLAILEALCHVVTGLDENKVSDEIIFQWIDQFDLRPQTNEVTQVKNGPDTFSFVVHPLTSHHIFKHRLLKKCQRIKNSEKIFEHLTAHLPGFYWGKIVGIKSQKTGKEVMGHIYMLGETPRMMMEKDPQVIYRKLIDLAEKSYEKGASLMGLGAYTKVIGDAGVSVAKRSPVPVTTGNSLSAMSTLWACEYVLEKMQLVPKGGAGEIYQGRVMVIGATGSIGKVCSKLLAKDWQEIILVAPRAYKLLQLKEEIEKLNHNCTISIMTCSEEALTTVDLVITTTSAMGKCVLDIEKLKPGAVVCDVSRPLDISYEDALKRPDILVFASGEVTLPGEVEITCDIGLEGNIVYACLAETALLTMASRFEEFSMGRDLDYRKVIEIDRMAKQHGVKLATIMGHSHVITDEEISLCVEHALLARKRQSGVKGK